MPSLIRNWRRQPALASADAAAPASHPLTDQGNGEEQAGVGGALVLPNRPALRIVKRANGAVRAFHTHGEADVRLTPDSPRPAEGSIRVIYRCPTCPRAEPIVTLPQERAE